MKISLLHPFTAKAIGFDESHLLDSHSIPQIKALKIIQDNKPEWEIIVEYFTGKSKIYSCFNLLKKTFYPISKISKLGKWRSEVSLIHLLKNIFNSPDVTIINTSGHGGKHVFKLAKLLNFKNKKYFAMLGGVHLELTPQLENYYKKASLIIVHTKLQKNALLCISFFKDKNIEVLPLGIDDSIFKEKSIIVKNSSIKQLLYVGRISRLKQVEIAIDSMVVIKSNNIECKLNIVGPISDLKYFNELKNLVIQLDLIDNVNFIASVKQEQLVSFYQNADVVLLPSKHESFGMVITEAMACGTPVISLEGSGGPEEIIVNGFDGFVVPGENYRNTVLKLLSDQSLLEELSKNALVSVKNKWSQNRTSEILLGLINENSFYD
jgi:glycosyltransferase involved in cell wall biosynthesis